MHVKQCYLIGWSSSYFGCYSAGLSGRTRGKHPGAERRTMPPSFSPDPHTDPWGPGGDQNNSLQRMEGRRTSQRLSNICSVYILCCSNMKFVVITCFTWYQCCYQMVCLGMFHYQYCKRYFYFIIRQSPSISPSLWQTEQPDCCPLSTGSVQSALKGWRKGTASWSSQTDLPGRRGSQSGMQEDSFTSRRVLLLITLFPFFGLSTI